MEPTVKEDITKSPKKTTPRMGFRMQAPSRLVSLPAWSKNALPAGVLFANVIQIG